MSHAVLHMTGDVRDAIGAMRRFVAKCEVEHRTIGDVPDEELAQLVDQIREGVHVRVNQEVKLFGTPTTEFVRAFGRAMRDNARKDRRAT